MLNQEADVAVGVLVALPIQKWQKGRLEAGWAMYTLFLKHHVYKHNQAKIIDILNTLLNTSQPQIFLLFHKSF